MSEGNVGQVSQGNVSQAALDEVDKSDLKSEAKDETKPAKSYGFMLDVAPWMELVEQCKLSSNVTMIFSKSIVEFIDSSKKSIFEMTMT